MPIYEYICLNESCGKINEVIQRVGAPAPDHCEFCDSGKLVKKASLPSFHLKGGGWYKDGYSDGKSETKETSSATNSNTNSGTSTDTPKADSKPKTEAKPASPPPAAAKSSQPASANP